MTEPRRPARRKLPWTPVVTGAVGLFAAILIGLAVQMRAGRDPVAGTQSRPATAQVVVVRRHVVTRRVVRVVHDDAGTSPTAASAPASTTAPPVAAAPPPTPAPAPAPVLTTRSS